MLLFPLVAFAAVLSPDAHYAVKKDLTSAAPAPAASENFYTAMVMDFESVDPSDPGTPLMSTHTDQLTKVRKLPKLTGKEVPKDGFVDRTEVTFERLENSSKVRVPGLKQPFETRGDLGAVLSAHPLVIRGDGKSGKVVDDLARIRAEALARVKDPTSAASLKILLNEDTLLRTGSALGKDGSCLGQLGGKKPGDAWAVEREEQGVKMKFECRFEGWAENAGKKIAVLNVRSGKQRVTRPQPNGVPGVAETESDGVIYFEAESKESVSRLDTKIRVEPADEERKRLEAKGQTVPRNESRMKIVTHVYGI